jgi:hypothetical protein
VFRSVRRPRCECDYDKMCHILEGTVRLTDADGVAKTFGPGGFVRGGGGVQGNLGKHHACASPGNAGSPYVNASSKAGYKGYNYQNNRRVTQNRPSIGSARARRPRPDRRLWRGAI